MTYIIENANLFKQNQCVKTSLLVNNGKILSVQPSFSKYRYMKMDTEDFLMTPTHVFYSRGLPRLEDGQTSKNYFIHQFLLNGCTTVLICSDKIQYVQEIGSTLKQVREFYDSSPLDYTIAIKMHINHFSVPVVQKCKREKIPAIFIEFDKPQQLYKIPWSWIREALFPYNCPLIPIVKASNDQKDKLLHLWNTILEREKIPHIKSELQEQTPLSLETLKKIGIYPMKGYLQAGGELSYNLFLTNKENLYEEGLSFDKHALSVTVHKGNVIRVGNKIYYNPKNGEELKISRPSFFK